MLARVLERIDKGDTLVVVRIDRLVRSWSHPLEVIERPEGKGAFYRLIQDSMDTGSPQAKSTLQVLGGGRVRTGPDPGTHQGQPRQRTHNGRCGGEPWAAG